MKLAADLTQVLYLVESGREEPLSYEPQGFKPVQEFEVIGSGPSWFRDQKIARKVYLHPSVSYKGKPRPRVRELLGGEGVEDM